MPYAIDLFCGAGGMSEGLIQAGFHILFSSDINEDVEKTYRNRHEQLGFIQDINTHFHRCDIRELTGELILDRIQNLKIFKNGSVPKEIDAIFGGPPCQGFSRAGKRNPNDPRNMLFREYLRVISEIKPKYVVFENVTGFVDTKLYGFRGTSGKDYPDGTLVLDILMSEFNLLNYNTLEPRILDAANFGVPQRRNRLIVIAYRKDVVPPKYPEPTHSDNSKVTVAEAIGDLILDNTIKTKIQNGLSQYQIDSIRGRTPNINGCPINSNGMIFNNELPNHSPLIKERFSLYQEGEDTETLRTRILAEGIDLSEKPILLQYCADILNKDKDEVIHIFKKPNNDINLINVLLTKKGIRTRLDSNKPSPTVVTIADDYISPFENRTFTVREMARLQSFDDSFVFLGKRTTGGIRRRIEVPQYSQVGNAVPPLLAKAIATKIKQALEDGQ